MSEEARKAMVHSLLEALVETVHESGGAPSSVICLGFQAELGFSTDAYMSFENALVEKGILARTNHYLTVNVETAQRFGFLNKVN